MPYSSTSAYDFVAVGPVTASEGARASQPSADSYQSQSIWCPKGARGAYGGQVIGQGLHSAIQTISDNKGLHSMHIHFLLPANPSIPIIYNVDRIRDGKSYATRSIRAMQGDKVVAVIMASYSTTSTSTRTVDGVRQPSLKSQTTGLIVPSEEPSVSHSLRFVIESSSKSSDRNERTTKASGTHRYGQGGDIPPFQPRYAQPYPDGILPMKQCELEPDRWTKFLSRAESSISPRRRRAVEEYIQERRDSPWEVAIAKSSTHFTPLENGTRRMVWLKPKIPSGTKVSLEEHKCIIACISDFQFIGAAARRIGLTAISKPPLGMLTSLDHTIYFYPFPKNLDPSAPLLHVIEAIIVDVQPGRGVVQGRIYTETGELIAVTIQEGVVRAGQISAGEGNRAQQAREKAKL
ncbi:thioesterase-like superfamily-domain-containing protein [Kockovaella imperatae]|uniref:Thioesterase-like superfamily-domain-containing protein n=1 Tax=Kockovaella imperatae TaxID=4999 RepID=A0A1Y1ULL7_9TREE|nr:thioesterase-like superfamily-domain-containing protein [Kockovaella imperatae]ORX38404.1 thioesterase-like superfamily-domain-containing protein [Kockovaella imperatae]